MNTFKKLAAWRLVEDVWVSRAVQAACYAAAPATLFLAAHGLARLASRPAEILIGMLAAGGLSIGLVVLGTLTGTAAEIRRR